MTLAQMLYYLDESLFNVANFQHKIKTILVVIANMVQCKIGQAYANVEDFSYPIVSMTFFKHPLFIYCKKIISKLTN